MNGQTAIHGKFGALNVWLQANWQQLTLVVLGLALYRPTLHYLFHYWWTNQYMQFGLLLPLALAYLVFLAWQRHHLTFQPTASSRRLGVGLITASVILHLLAVRAETLDVSAFTLISFALGLVTAYWGKPALKHTWTLFAIFALAIPNPMLIFAEVTTWRWQVYSSTLTAIIASMIGLSVDKAGVNLAVPGHCQITVAEACSGCKTFIGLLAFAIIYLALVKAPLYKKLVLVAVTAPIAVFSNALRLVSILLVGRFWGQEAAMSFHDHSGLGLSLLALGLLLLVGRWLKCALWEEPASASS